MIDIVRTMEGLDALRENWNELFARSSTATTYQDWQFVRTTWQLWHRPNDRLHILCYCQGSRKEYDAILPCYIDGSGRLRLIDFMTDFCEGVVPDELLESYDMYKEFSDFLAADTEVRWVCFDNLRSGSRLMAYLYGLGAEATTRSLTGYTVVRMRYDEANKDFVDGLQGANSKLRSHMRREIKKTEHFDFRMLEGEEPFPNEAIRQLGDYMVEAGMRDPGYLSDNFYAYFRQLYEQRLLKVGLLEDRGQLCACKFFLHDKNADELISWVTLYRMAFHNSTMMNRAMDWMYRRSLYNYDLARGVYAYKLANFHPGVYILHRLCVYRSRKDALRGMAREVAAKVWRGMKRLIIKN